MSARFQALLASVSAAGGAPDITAAAIQDMGVGVNGGHVYAVDGTYTPGSPAATLTYQWLVDDVNVSGATAPTFDNDFLYARNGTLKCTVTATNASGSDNFTTAGVAIVSFDRYKDPSGKFPVLILDFEHAFYARDLGHGLVPIADPTTLVIDFSAIEDSGDGENGLRVNSGTADVPSVLLSSFFYNADGVEGNTIYVKAKVDTAVASCRLVQVDDLSTSDRVGIYMNSGVTTWRMLMTSASVSQADADVLAYSAGAEARIAFAYRTNDMGATGNGGTTTTDTAATLPVGLVELHLGNQHGASGQATTSHIKCLVMWGYRMSNADTDTLSGNAAYGDPT